jgi:hypothetical protein
MRIKRVHYDITDLCNAGCPQCARTDTVGCLPKSWLKQQAVSLEDFRRFSPTALLQEIESAYFCGNFGDPAVVPEMIDILAYCWEANPDLQLRVHSNCSVRSVGWWRELGALAKGRRFRLISAIDGTSHETNRRYRVRTDFDRIMDNTAAFIDAGGQAEWWMLVFRHNEHEVGVAEETAKARGFMNFRAYPSNRFGGLKELTYSHKGEEFTLEPPTVRLSPKTPRTNSLDGEKPPETEVVIECEALHTSEAFMDFFGYLAPCCHIGRRLYMRDQGAFRNGDDWMDDVFETFDARRLNVGAVGYDAARAAYEEFIDHLRPYWQRKQPLVCRMVCGRKREKG